MANDEKLPEVNILRLFSKQGIGNHLLVIFNQHCPIVARQSVTHSLLQLGHRHRVAVPLIADELVVQFSEQRAVFKSGESEGHG